MADNPHKSARRPRPLSPFVTIYHWPVTMATSITHRMTGIGLAGGLVVLTWWLVAIARGDAKSFIEIARTPLGEVILFLITWSLAFHLLNGIRHLAWDMGFGFSKGVARTNSWVVILGSIVVAAGFFAAAYLGYGGYYTMGAVQ
jgi:succinate dehydrogenase / fumarate reductase cytochrome b subunit